MLDIEPPDLRLCNFPEDEHGQIWTISGQLGDLSSYLKNFEAAVSLFDFCIQAIQSQRGIDPQINVHGMASLHRWQLIAGRDGAMTIYHFAKTMTAIRAGMSKCSSFRQLVNHDILRAATKLFEQLFPDFEGIRHAVAHTAELVRTAEATKMNSFTGSCAGSALNFDEADRLMLRSVLLNRQFTLTWNAKLLSYDVSRQTTELLARVLQQLYSGFAGAAEAQTTFCSVN